MLFSLVAAVATAWVFAATAAAQLTPPNIAFNVTSLSSAGFLWYYPDGLLITSNNTKVWNQSWETTSPGSNGVTYVAGNSYHYAQPSTSPTAVFCTFVGSRIILYGGYDNFTWGTDGRTPQMMLNWTTTSAETLTPPSDPTGNEGIIADSGELEYGHHDVKVFTTSGLGWWSVSSVTIETGLVTTASDYSLVPTYDEYAVVNGTKNTRWSYPGGKWEVQSPLDQASAEIISDWAADNFSTVLNGLASPKVVIDIPANTSYVMVNGSTDTFQGTYYVDIEPKQYNYLYPAKLNQPTGSGSSYYIAPHTMAMTSLDPTVKYNMTIAGATGSSNTIVISGVKYWAGVTNSTWPDFSPINNTVVIHDPGKTKANTAAIAGGVVGGVLGGAVIATIAWFWYRKRARTKYSEDPNFVIDEGPEPSLQPFLQDDSRGVTANMSMTNGTYVTHQAYANNSGATPVDNSGGYSPEAMGFNSPADSKAQQAAAISMAGGATAAGTAAAASRPRRQGRVEQESDAGGLEPAEDEPVEYVPPMYDPQWATRGTGSSVAGSSVTNSYSVAGSEKR